MIYLTNSLISVLSYLQNFGVYTVFSSSNKKGATRIMSSEFHSLLIHGDHTRCIEVYNNKNTEDLENDAEKSFAKTSVLLHQNCDSYPEAFHHVNLNSELNPLHVHKESIERPVHGIQNDLFSQILGQGALFS